MWERWNGDEKKSDPSMNSYNHLRLWRGGRLDLSLRRGIDTTSSDPGFHTIYLHPNFNPELGRIDFSYDLTVRPHSFVLESRRQNCSCGI
jgi:alpha-L-rhamnosidase